MIVNIIDKLFLCYMVMLFVRIMSSWFPEYQNHSFLRFVAYYTDPYLNLFRRVIPPLGMIDISPMIAFFALKIIENITKALVS
jgi:YggT family protein